MWYYVEKEKQQGPVTEAELDTLCREGKIQPETMVWREGMANWQPLREIRTGAADGSKVGVPQVACSQCGGLFSPSEVIRYGNVAVCAACKPAFVQKLKEGANVTTGVMEYASFGARFAALFVDNIVVVFLIFAVSFVIGAAWGVTRGVAGWAQSPSSETALGLVSTGVSLCIIVLYFTYFIGKSGQTPGKKLCKIRVVNPDGSPVGYGKAMGRFFGYYLSCAIFYIGFLMAAWDEEKRALHDRLCNTRVIKR